MQLACGLLTGSLNFTITQPMTKSEPYREPCEFDDPVEWLQSLHYKDIGDLCMSIDDDPAWPDYLDIIQRWYESNQPEIGGTIKLAGYERIARNILLRVMGHNHWGCSCKSDINSMSDLEKKND